MLEHFLLLFTLVLLGVCIFYLLRFAKIIMIFENDVSKALRVFQLTEKSLEDCLSMPMFFDSPQVQEATMEALETVKTSKIELEKVISKFTELSEKKYVEEVEEEDR